jgi:hypothetical protein
VIEVVILTYKLIIRYARDFNFVPDPTHTTCSTSDIFTYVNAQRVMLRVPQAERIIVPFKIHAYRCVWWVVYPANCAKYPGPGSVVGIATGYGLDGPGIESGWGATFSAAVQTGPGAYPASCTMGTGSFPGVKSGRGLTLTPHPLLVP